MKQLFTILFILPFFSFGQSQLPLKDGKVFYETVDTIPSTTKIDLYNKSKIWFVNTFNSAKAVLQMDDKEAGIIMGKGITPYEGGNAFSGPIHNSINYTININIKDNKYRIQVYDISISNENASYTPEYCLKYPKMNKKKLEKIDDSVKELIASFKTAINKKSEDNF
jgi:hypothetical protein